MKYKLKDSGKRQQFKSGMVRDIQEGKPRFDLMMAKYIPYEESMLYRWAMLMSKGAKKYDARNWEKANSEDEIDRGKSSAWRHFMAWYFGIEDEDHAAALFYNVNLVESLKWKLKNKDKGLKPKKPEDQYWLGD